MSCPHCGRSEPLSIGQMKREIFRVIGYEARDPGASTLSKDDVRAIHAWVTSKGATAGLEPATCHQPAKPETALTD